MSDLTYQSKIYFKFSLRHMTLLGGRLNFSVSRESFDKYQFRVWFISSESENRISIWKYNNAGFNSICLYFTWYIYKTNHFLKVWKQPSGGLPQKESPETFRKIFRKILLTLLSCFRIGENYNFSNKWNFLKVFFNCLVKIKFRISL